MVVEAQKRLLTADEFARLPAPADGSKQELVRGEVVSMPPPGLEHGEVQLMLGALLMLHVRANRLGQVVTETGVVTRTGPDTVRGPDVSYWSAERLPLDRAPEDYPEKPADLCAEVLSPSNTQREMNAKVREYLAAGVRMVWVIDPANRMVTAFRKPDEGRVLLEGATLDGEDVVPGFACKVADLFG